MTLSSYAHSDVGTQFVLASPEDDAAICRFLAKQSMHGAGMSVVTRTEPSFFAAARLMGDEPQVMLAKHAGAIVGLGVRTRRGVRLHGEVVRVGHLSYLRLGEAVRRRRDFLRAGYGFLRELQRADPVPFHLTAILDDNVAAKRLLEAGLPSLPRYTPLCGLSTFVLSAQRLARGGRAEKSAPAGSDGVLPFIKSTWAGQALPPAMIVLHAGATHFCFVREGEEIVAAASVWDQRHVRQVMLTNMPLVMKLGRPFINPVRMLTGRPAFPPQDTPLNLAFISHVAVREGAAPELFVQLLKLLAAEARQLRIDYLALSLPTEHPLAKVAAGLTENVTRSTLYSVHWEGDPEPPEVGANPYVEAALL